MLGVDNVIQAVDYYVDMLGFDRPSHIFGAPDDKVSAIVRRGGIEIHLQIRRAPDERARGPHDGDVYVFVPDAKVLRDEFANNGVHITRDIEAEPYGMLDFTVETPSGHRLTFGSKLAPEDVPPAREE
jgi:catechol 2,3-dioxygenase-like lactoylglutathione lyase family enzyme